MTNQSQTPENIWLKKEDLSIENGCVVWINKLARGLRQQPWADGDRAIQRGFQWEYHELGGMKFPYLGIVDEVPKDVVIMVETY